MFGWKKSTRLHRMAEWSGALNGSLINTRGLIAGTRVATQLGWRMVEALQPGDVLLTFDNGLQPLIDVRRHSLPVDAERLPCRMWPVCVPAGALGNTDPMTLMADQGVMTESDVADDLTGDPFAVVRACHLVGLRGTSRPPLRQQLDIVTLVFAEDQVVYANGGAILHCGRETASLEGLLTGVPSHYANLPKDIAAMVLEEMQHEDALHMRMRA